MILEDPKTAAPTSVEGLQGWLIPVGIGFCLAPARLLGLLAENAQALEAETWAALTTPGAETYHPLWAPVLIAEPIANVVLLGLSLISVYVFFRRRRRFPRMAITYLAAGVAIAALDLLVVRMIPAAAARLDPSVFLGLAQAAVVAAIWIPYLLVSERVRTTFVR